MATLFNHGSEFFREAEQMYSKFCFDLFMLNTAKEKEAFATETAHKIQEWRDRWSRDPKASPYLPLITAVDFISSRKINEGD